MSTFQAKQALLRDAGNDDAAVMPPAAASLPAPFPAAGFRQLFRGA